MFSQLFLQFGHTWQSAIFQRGLFLLDKLPCGFPCILQGKMDSIAYYASAQTNKEKCVIHCVDFIKIYQEVYPDLGYLAREYTVDNYDQGNLLKGP